MEKQHNHEAKVRARIYAPEAQAGAELALSKEDIRHLKVLNVQKGELIRIFDGKGHEYEAPYDEKVRLNKEIQPRKEASVAITLATATPKGDRMDVLVEKVSELGVLRIVPISCERGIVKPRDTKLERLQKIAIEACAQSERAVVPTIDTLTSFKAVLSTIKEYDNAYICHPDGEAIGNVGKKILLLVGPEGGFTDNEITQAVAAGAKKIKLSNSILRVETAAITAVALTKGL